MTDAPDPKLTLSQRLRMGAIIRYAKYVGNDSYELVDRPQLPPLIQSEAAERIDELEAALSELWALRMMRMSCSVMTAQQSSEYAARSDAAWAAVQSVLEEK